MILAHFGTKMGDFGSFWHQNGCIWLIWYPDQRYRGTQTTVPWHPDQRYRGTVYPDPCTQTRGNPAPWHVRASPGLIYAIPCSWWVHRHGQPVATLPYTRRPACIPGTKVSTRLRCVLWSMRVCTPPGGSRNGVKIMIFWHFETLLCAK